MANGYGIAAIEYLQCMKTDALSRRLRFAAPNPKVRPPKVPEHIQLAPGDIAVFEAIRRHGPLPIHYLFEFQKDLRKGYKTFQYRLRDLFHGDEGGSYLSRPPRQFDSYEARYQHIVYGLTDRAEKALEARGSMSFPRPKSNDFVHDLMTAMATASIELSARSAGIEFISFEDILRHERCPRTTRAAKNPLTIELGRRKVTPDALFGLRYPDGKFKFFVFEADRGTERVRSADHSQTSFGQKLSDYAAIIRSQLFHERWGIPNLNVLTLLTMAGRRDNLIEFARSLPSHQGRFYFAVEPSFGSRYAETSDAHWTMPKDVLRPLLQDPWQTVEGPRHINRP